MYAFLFLTFLVMLLQTIILSKSRRLRVINDVKAHFPDLSFPDDQWTPATPVCEDQMPLMKEDQTEDNGGLQQNPVLLGSCLVMIVV